MTTRIEIVDGPDRADLHTAFLQGTMIRFTRASPEKFSWGGTFDVTITAMEVPGEVCASEAHPRSSSIPRREWHIKGVVQFHMGFEDLSRGTPFHGWYSLKEGRKGFIEF